MSSKIIYVGLKAHVVAIATKEGATLWKTKLKAGAATGNSFVSLLVEGRFVYAHTLGELFCLDAQTGAVLWKNALEGLGYDIANLAVEGGANSSPPVAAYRRQQDAEAATNIAMNTGN